MRIRKRHYDILRALNDGPLHVDALASRTGTSPVVADLRATELLPTYVSSIEDLWAIRDAGRDLLTGSGGER